MVFRRRAGARNRSRYVTEDHDGTVNQVTETNIQTFIDSAPTDLRTRIAGNADPVLRSHLQRIAARPETIKRLRAKEAEEVIAHVDDPATLARIRLKDRRVGVGLAVTSNPAWSDVPHRLLCAECTDTTTTTTNGEELQTAIIEQKISCKRRIMRELHRIGDPALWEDELLQRLLKDTSALGVEIAAGRTPAGLSYAAVKRNRYYSTSEIRPLLADEDTATGALLCLASTTTRTVPRHWRPTVAQWKEAFCGEDESRSLLTLVNGPGLAVVETLWEHIPRQQRHWALQLASTNEEVIRVATRLEDDPEFGDVDHGPALMTLLCLGDDLPEQTRMTVVKAMGSSTIAEYLAGRGGFCPKPGEVRPLLEVVARKEQRHWHTHMTGLVRMVNRAVESMPMRHHKELLDALVDICPASLVLSAPGALAHAGHRRLWATLDTATHAETVAMLLREWDGTIDELIETAVKL